MTTKLIIFILLSLLTLQSSIFNRVFLSNKDAVCLDGSPAVYYLSEGTGVNASKFVVWFEGGGWCGSSDLATTISSCHSRSLTDLGSSKNYSATQNFTTHGVLSGQATVNPTYYDWTRVAMKYCDGTGHQGTKSQPVSYKGSDMYFRGQNITIQTFNQLNATHKIFSNTSQILLTGGSAGGLATYVWANYVHDHAKGKVWAVPDAGLFLDVENSVTKKYDYRTRIQSFMKLSNVEVEPPVPECVKKYANQTWRCMFAEYLHQFIRAPLFSVNSLYDSWSIPNILGITCLNGSSLKDCNQADRKYIDEYHFNMSKKLHDIAGQKGNGAWAPACAYHTEVAGSSWTSANFRVPQHSQYSIDISVMRWMAGTNDTHTHIDSVSWPNNTPCAGATINSIRVEE